MSYKPTIGDHFMFYGNGASWILLTDHTVLRFDGSNSGLAVKSMYIQVGHINQWLKGAYAV